MQAVTPRRTFGQKNTVKTSVAQAPDKRKASRKSAVTINPLILAGGGIFALIVLGVLVLGGPPTAPTAGAPQITELPKATPSTTAASTSASPAPKPAASGGKFGAATDAMSGTSR